MPVVEMDLLETPGYVVAHGWRDIPMVGPDSCAECEGWGCKTTTIQNGSVVHRNCPECRGRGRL